MRKQEADARVLKLHEKRMGRYRAEITHRNERGRLTVQAAVQTKITDEILPHTETLPPAMDSDFGLLVSV